MSTKLTDQGDHVLVQTVAAKHGRARRPYGGVRVLKSDKAAVKAEVVRQALLLRRSVGLEVNPEETVV